MLTEKEGDYWKQLFVSYLKVAADEVKIKPTSQWMGLFVLQNTVISIKCVLAQ